MNRLANIIRNICLAVLTLTILGALVAADWYVRYDPDRKAKRLLEAQDVPLTPGGAIMAAEAGSLFNLEQLAILGIDLGAPHEDTGITPLVAAMRSEREEAVKFLLGRKDVRVSLDMPVQPDNDTALTLALRRNDLELAKQLTQLGADPEVRFDPERPLLIDAYRDQNWPIFDFLIGAGVDPDAAAPGGETPLLIAVAEQNGERIGQLLEAGADPESVGTTGDSLLMETLTAGNHDLADLLLSNGANPDHYGASRQTPLIVAVKAGNTTMAEMLLSHGADPNLAARGKEVPLVIATQAQDADLMQVLIDSGAKVNSPALMKTAFGNRDLPGLALLLRSGAEPDVKIGRGRTLLDEALATRSRHVARTLLEAGASAKGRLWSALGTGDEDLVAMVLQFGAGVREEDPKHGLPLDFALSEGRGEIVSLLLANGANPNVKRSDGQSWIASAIQSGDEEIVNALVGHGACLDGIEATDGHSLLAWAIAHGMKEVVAQLIAEGADVRAREKAPASKEFVATFERSKTFRWHLQVDSKINPLMLAAAQGDVEIAQMLLEAGAQKGEYSRRYLWPVNIAAWHMDVDMMQVILGRDPDPERQPRKLIINLSDQRVTVYKSGRAVYSSKVSTGKKGYRTPTGTYVITDKHRHHNSSIYGSSMPYFMRLSCAAFGLHQGNVPNYPASHGCIRLPYSGAKHLFVECEVGDVVQIKY